jgi:hypothetical protein
MADGSQGEDMATRNTVVSRGTGSVVQAGRDVHVHGTGWAVVPDQLPRVASGFVGRDAELAELGRVGASARGPLVLTGLGGAGKSALAVRWLAGMAGFEGSLYAVLGGPAAPADVLEWFLLSLGVPPEHVPMDEERRAALYRSVTAGRRLRVLLDDAVSARQVRPLLPAAGSVVVVTSRSLLSGLALDGARWVEVGPLSGGDSVRLLESVVGAERVAAEPGQARALAGLCGGLPLALSVVGARLATRTKRSLAWEVGRLGNERKRLHGLTLDADVSVGAALDLSVRGLAEPLRAAYRVCAWHPGREFGVPVLAAGAGVDEADMAARVEDLREAGLVSEVADQRYALHDLVRLHGRGGGGSSVVRGMVEWYLDRSVACELTVHPLRPRIGPRFADARATGTAETALAWAESERANVRAAVDTAAEQGWDELVWQFCEALWGRFLHTRRYAEWIDLHRVGIRSAGRCGDARAEGRLRNQLAYAYAQIGEADSAARESTHALELARDTGDGHGEATAWEQLGLAVRRTDPAHALHCLHRSRDLNARLDRPRGVALCRRRIGELLADQGDLTAAEELTASATTMAELRNGNPTRALQALADAVTAMRDTTTALTAWTVAATLSTGLNGTKAHNVRARELSPPHRT